MSEIDLRYGHNKIIQLSLDLGFIGLFLAYLAGVYLLFLVLLACYVKYVLSNIKPGLLRFGVSLPAFCLCLAFPLLVKYPNDAYKLFLLPAVTMFVAFFLPCRVSVLK